MTTENNGGKTGYYDLPLPDREEIKKVLLDCSLERVQDLPSLVDKIISLCPQTLNDIIEHKNMQPWQHEVLKATYAIDARAEKNGGSYERELNKISYYTERGRKVFQKKRHKESEELSAPLKGFSKPRITGPLTTSEIKSCA